VREGQIIRALVALVCIVVLVLCTAIDPPAAHLDFVIPVLAFCFLAALTPFLLRFSGGDPAVQPLSFLSVRTSRAPPLA
jgi:hypothetical protein